MADTEISAETDTKTDNFRSLVTSIKPLPQSVLPDMNLSSNMKKTSAALSFKIQDPNIIFFNLFWRLLRFVGSQFWSDTFWLSISVLEKTNWRDYLPRSCLRWTWACAWWSEACLPCRDWSQDLWAFDWPKKEGNRGEGLHFWNQNKIKNNNEIDGSITVFAKWQWPRNKPIMIT